MHSTLTTVPKIQFCIPRNETAQPHSQFLNSCTWEYINHSQIHECGNWETEHHNSVLEITSPTVSFMVVHKSETDIYIGFSLVCICSACQHASCLQSIEKEDACRHNKQEHGLASVCPLSHTANKFLFLYSQK
jgi:hypothetical protein